MSKLEEMRKFIAGCPFIDKFTDDIHIDWTDAEPGDYGIMPTGESIIRTEEDILGNRILYKQYNVSLYGVRFTVNDIVRIESSGFLEDFTAWIEEQSFKGTAPVFGDNPEEEYITAQNGMLFQLSADGRTGRYQIQIQCFYEKHYRKDD